MPTNITRESERFEYKDVDYLGSPLGWLEARLRNRFNEGYHIFRDEINMSWKGVKQLNEMRGL